MNADEPKRIGSRYDVVAELGRGGMAVVYRVRDQSGTGELALKQLLPADASRAREARELFEREYRVLAQLRHPSVVEVYDFGVDAVGPYYTMELLDGGDLGARSPLDHAYACQVIAQICSSLSLLHSRGFVHRDVSPRNVRFTRGGVAKLIDFGAMVPVGPCAHGVGTPGFVAPEVVHHLPLDARTDVFSTGATLYYALTGQRPFAARTLAELPAAWLKGPEPFGPAGDSLPAALKELIASTLQVEAARRPRNAFEVQQRLAAITGTVVAESLEASQAYLSTPVLVGRNKQLRQFRHYLRRTMQGDGLGIVVQGASGSGRSRLVETFALESKTSGAIVLRADGRGARPEPLALAHRLAEQLVEALPDESVASAVQAGVFEQVFASHDGRTLQPLARWLERRREVQAALPKWWKCVSEQHTLVIAIDDVERIDDVSLAVLIALVDAAAGSHLLVVTTASNVSEPNASPARAVLAAHSTPLPIASLTAAETEELFTSVFSGAPHVGLVSVRVHKLAAGSPRDSLSLAQYLVDRGFIRFSEGSWTLPAELPLSALPASAEAALRKHVDQLAPLPRRLLESQCLAIEGPWALSDYRGLGSDADAVVSLLRTGLIVERDGTYTISHPGVRACVLEQIPAERVVELERALAALCADTQRPRVVEVMHWLQAGEHARGLERLMDVWRSQPTATALYEQCGGVEGTTIARVLERACEISIASGRPPRERAELRRTLIELSITTDNGFYYRHAPAWLLQLERDTGLVDFRASDPARAPAERLQAALVAASARHAALPEEQRVYPPDEAIRMLARYVPLSTAIGARGGDTRLISSLHSLLEPFVGLSPILHALWQNAIASTELSFKGRYDDARKRLVEIYERLEYTPGVDDTHIDAVRYAVAHAIAMIDVTLGYPTSEQWLSTMERDPLQRVTGLYLRRALAILDGDPETAERYRKQAEVLAVQASSRQMFEAPTALELYLQVQAGDLTGVKLAMDRLSQLSAESPGWVGSHHFAQASFQRLRGDLVAAKAAYERALAQEDPERVDPPAMLRVWAAVAEGYVLTLDGLGQFNEAYEFGVRASETCERLGLSGFYGIARALAVVEARLGRHAEAVARLEGLMQKRAGLRPSLRALDFEARARVAIRMKDVAAAAHFIALATDPSAIHGTAQQLAKRGALLDEARQAGLKLDVQRSPLESALHISSVRPVDPHANAMRAHVAAALGPLSDPGTRAERALALLAEALDARVGQLYYASGPVVTRAAALGSRDAALERFIAGYWRHRQQQAAITTVFTAQQLDALALATGSWKSAKGKVYTLIPLSPAGEAECVGVVALESARSPIPATYWSLSAALSAQLVELGDPAHVARGA